MASDFPVRIPWRGSDIPHCVIEVNQCCNIHCRGCYKDKRAYQKPLQQVCNEIDLIASRRNLSAITLAGGEPTLHPELSQIVEHIRSKGIHAGMLTNGTLLTPAKAESLRSAGLSRVFLHIDKHQRGRPDMGPEPLATEADLNALRGRYIGICRGAKLDVALALTLYKDALEDFIDVLQYCYQNAGVDRILVTNYSAMLNAASAPEDGLEVKNTDVSEVMARRQGAHPAWYLPSSHDEQKTRWLFYAAAVTVDRDGLVDKLYLHPANRRSLWVLPRLTRVLSGKHRVEGRLPALQAAVGLSLYTAMSMSLELAREASRLVAKAVRNGNLRMFSLVFQDGPTRLADGSYETCFECPDATVRNGKVIPVCLADHLDPLTAI